MTSVGVIVLSASTDDSLQEALSKISAVDLAATSIVVLRNPSASSPPDHVVHVAWPSGSGAAFAVNAGVEALVSATTPPAVIVVLADSARWDPNVLEHLASDVESITGPALVVAAGVQSFFSAMAFRSTTWERAGGVHEGYLDFLADVDFGHAVRNVGGQVVRSRSAHAVDQPPDPPLSLRVRNELMMRSRWSSPIKLWTWVLLQLVRAAPKADGRHVLRGLANGMSWRHTEKLMEPGR